MYKIQYLPIALDDLKKIIRYITHELESPRAANNFLLKVDKEVQKLKKNPFRCHLYTSSEKLNYEYRILYINNYSLFYVIENSKVEVHRVIYSGRDIPSILKEKK